MKAKLAAMLDGVLGLDPTAQAVEFQGAWWTWGDIARVRQDIVAALDAERLQPGTRVGVALRNRPELIAPVILTAADGHCLVTINPTYPDGRLAEDIAKLAAPVFIASTVDWARPALAEAAMKSGALCLEATPDRNLRVRQLMTPGRLREPAMTAPAVGVEMLTSGTTGTPKRIPLPAANFERAVMSAVLFEAGRSDEDPPRLRSGVQLLLAPFAHIGGLMALLNAIASGRKSCLLEKFSVSGFHDAVMRHRPRTVSTPPAALKMIFDAKLPRDDLASLSAWRTGTAPLDPDLADAFFQAYGIPVLQNYGATEFGGVAGWTLPDFKAHWSVRRGAVGRLNPGVDGRVVDGETGELLAPGAQGVLELRGPQIGDGRSWLRTTDLAVLDDERFLWIKGRSDNAITRGGFKIQPGDIVAAIEAHPSVREAAVAALPDARLGEVPGAAYVLKSGAPRPSQEELIAFLRERLLPYQLPTQILLADELPRTDSMKVSQPALRELLLASQPS
jgi:acyl-coenzyme A synthetase/AMP-(fatty) acid ligase